MYLQKRAISINDGPEIARHEVEGLASLWAGVVNLNNNILIFRRHSQVVRQRSAKPLYPGSNPGAASKYLSYEV